jgi:hypothetical protein
MNVHTAARRLHTSVLAPAEKRALIWLAVRMPGWVNSDHLTGLALAAMLGAGLSYWLASVTPIGLVLVSFLPSTGSETILSTLARAGLSSDLVMGSRRSRRNDPVAFLLGGLAFPVTWAAVAIGVLVAPDAAVKCFATHALGTFG